MSDNSRITIILAVAMTLAVIFSVLLFVYLFYRAQTKRLQDVEMLPKSHQASTVYDKPLPPLPYMQRAGALLSSPQPSGTEQRSPPPLLQRRQAAQSKNRVLPFRELQLDHGTHVQRERPAHDDQNAPEKEVEDIPIGFSPDMRTVPFDSTPQTPLAPRLSKHAISKLRDAKLREAKLRDGKRPPPIELHPAFESVPEEHSPETQNTPMAGNRI